MSDKSTAAFLQDQLEALLASPALAPVAQRSSNPGDEPAVLDRATRVRDFDMLERDTEPGDTKPSVDVQLLRAALQAGLK